MDQKDTLMRHSYVIVDDNPESILATRAQTVRFQNFTFAGVAHNYNDAVDLILEVQPDFVFLEIDPENKNSGLSLALINELFRYLKVIPKIIITTKTNEFALSAIRHEVFDYCLKPIKASDIRKSIMRFELMQKEANREASLASEIMPPITNKEVQDPPLVINKEEQSGNDQAEVHIEAPLSAEDNLEDGEVVIETGQELHQVAEKDLSHTFSTDHIKSLEVEKPLIICVKSYGDYRFIDATEICYLQADNNSTDIHLRNGEMITAFKTLKHFENVLASPFVRIHNSYIVNIDYVSRIHTGNSVCYIKDTTNKLPFSKTYKENVDAIIGSISNGNYLEI